MKRLGFRLLGLFSEGLGLHENRLRGLGAALPFCKLLPGPFCPETRKTMGITSHTDPGVMTVLLQDMSGGLQVLYDGKGLTQNPVPAALVVNIGDLLQIMSNDNYTSGLHRVVANPKSKARLSVATVFSKGIMERTYGPLPELVTAQNPARFYNFLYREYLRRFFEKQLGDKTKLETFRITD